MLLTGIDLIETERIKKSMENPGFLKRILGEEEYARFSQTGSRYESVAGVFAAKEAFVKAMGTGFRGVSPSEIEVMKDEFGKPYFKLSGGAQVLAEGFEISLSVTHTKKYAAAVVVCQKEER